MRDFANFGNRGVRDFNLPGAEPLAVRSISLIWKTRPRRLREFRTSRKMRDCNRPETERPAVQDVAYSGVACVAAVVGGWGGGRAVSIISEFGGGAPFLWARKRNRTPQLSPIIRKTRPVRGSANFGSLRRRAISPGRNRIRSQGRLPLIWESRPVCDFDNFGNRDRRAISLRWIQNRLGCKRFRFRARFGRSAVSLILKVMGGARFRLDGKLIRLARTISIIRGTRTVRDFANPRHRVRRSNSHGQKTEPWGDCGIEF